MVSSINTNIAAYFAQANIGVASNAASASVSRLSSGNRIVKASDDVAALSIGTSLRTSVSTLRVALTNTAQGSSLLQVADGALSQVTEILQRQKAIALQAGSGSLTDGDRGFLNQEFQALKTEIDRLTGATNFNGVRLLNGSLSDTVQALSNTSNSTAGQIKITFTTAPAADDTIVINGVTLTLKASPAAAGQVQLGGSIEETLDNVVAYLNAAQTSTGATALTAANKLLVSKASYAREGNNTLTISARTGGSLAEFYRVNAGSVATGTWATGVAVSGRGRESTLASSSINLSNIDSDATSVFSTSNSGGILIDGVTLATVGTGDSIRSIVNEINSNTSTTGYSAFITGTTGAYVVNLRTANTAATGADTGSGLGSVTFANPVDNDIVSFAGGGASGLGQASTIGTGSTGGSFSILTDQTQQVARSVISFPDIAAGDLTATSNFGTSRTITIEGQAFTFTQTALTARAQTEITIGASLQETLDNAVAAINSFAGADSVNYSFRQIQARREGNTIVIENKQVGNALDISAGTLTVTASLMTGSSVSSADLSNTSNTGIDASGVQNSAFIGKISGFSASFVSANTIDIQVSVGGIIYRAKNVTSNPSSNTDVRFISETGGYFDVKLRANQGVEVNDSAGANTFAQRLEAAFSGVTFSQKRQVSSYDATGSLIGSSINLQLTDFTDVKIEGIKVLAPSGSNPNGSISLTINGEAYTAQVALGTQLGAYSITRFVSASDANKFLEFRNGGTVLGFDTDTKAAALELALKNALGVSVDGKANALSFQIGATADDTLAVSIGNATTDALGIEALSVSTQGGAAAASAALDVALSTVTSLRAAVGALQSRFNFAAANIQISVQNQDAARGELLDTDIASESTAYATAQVKLQAGISVLAQSNQLQQGLLKLIG